MKNCSCVAYAYDAGIGCMLWSRDLIDVQKFSNRGVNLYIRLPSSELDKGNSEIIVITTVISGMVMILIISALFLLRRMGQQRGGVTSMDDFLKEFFPNIYTRKEAHLHETDYCKYDNQLLTLFKSSLYFAGLVSTFGASSVTRNKGRRANILVGAVSFFLGGASNAGAVNITILIIGRILLAAGI
ncbi:hypothetical protein GOBAR_DD36233 [Gossypium barbadense]|nr:hypothetical protein GOBAR_DD36233 [Gossypium barbadense]